MHKPEPVYEFFNIKMQSELESTMTVAETPVVPVQVPEPVFEKSISLPLNEVSSKTFD